MKFCSYASIGTMTAFTFFKIRRTSGFTESDINFRFRIRSSIFYGENIIFLRRFYYLYKKNDLIWKKKFFTYLILPTLEKCCEYLYHDFWVLFLLRKSLNSWKLQQSSIQFHFRISFKKRIFCCSHLPSWSILKNFNRLFRFLSKNVRTS